MHIFLKWLTVEMFSFKQINVKLSLDYREILYVLANWSHYVEDSQAWQASSKTGYQDTAGGTLQRLRPRGLHLLVILWVVQKAAALFNRVAAADFHFPMRRRYTIVKQTTF